jgi:hypothetical protein
LSLLPAAFAQTTIRVTGHVIDPSGAVVAGAHVSAVNDQTDQSITVDAGPDGTFSLDLAPASYLITVSAPGFARYTRSAFSVAAGAATLLEITLQRPHPSKAAPPPPQPPPPPPTPAPVSPAEPDQQPTERPSPPVSRPGPATAARPPSVSGRSFLTGNDSEESGYGLYSYLLFAAAPANDDEKQRDLAVIQAFVKLLNDVSDLQSVPGMTKGDINVTYLLVAESPHEKVPSPDWILSHYDFPRAKVLLRVFHRDVFGGPYVASSLMPLSQSAAAPDHYLWQDMSHVPSDLAASWEEEFERRARRPDFWAPDKRNQEILGLRDFIANAASGLAEVNTASASFKAMLASWVSWK